MEHIFDHVLIDCSFLRVCVRVCLQISIALREWDIPFEELAIGEKIGSGRFGTVHK